MGINKAMVNAIVLCVIDNINLDGDPIFVRSLRSCKARVGETKHWYILQSYGTVVAAIDKQSGYLYDFLRYVYGYSAISAQHISKFAVDYHATQRYTYRP